MLTVVPAMGAPASVSAGAADLQQVIHGPLIIGVAAVVRGHQGAVRVDEEVGGGSGPSIVNVYPSRVYIDRSEARSAA